MKEGPQDDTLQRAMQMAGTRITRPHGAYHLHREIRGHDRGDNKDAVQQQLIAAALALLQAAHEDVACREGRRKGNSLAPVIARTAEHTSSIRPLGR